MKAKNFTTIKSTAFLLKSVSLLVTGLFMAQPGIAQMSYTFTSAGATGSLGPTQTQVNSAYVSTSLDGSVVVSGQGVQEFTLPVGGYYRVTAIGAQGGGADGGRGAYIAGDFLFSNNEAIRVVVGQQGITQAGEPNACGGGGGTYVMRGTANTTANILVIAGGGGGSPAQYSNGRHASITTTANNGAGVDNTDGAGGSNGSGGHKSVSASSLDRAAGGGGFFTDGQNIAQTAGRANGGKAFVNGSAGGSHNDDGAAGGFGGGGAVWTTGFRGAGGGGGFSGGGGGQTDANQNTQSGGGGGSFNNGTNQTNSVVATGGDGLVIIERLCDVNVSASSNPICEGASVTLSTNAGSNISWSTGPTTASIVVSPTTTTSYTVTGVSSSSSACSSTLAITVSVNPIPEVSVVVVPNVICNGQAATVFPSGAVGYSWSAGNVASPSIALSPTATSVFTVTGENVFGCTNTQTFMVQVANSQLAVSPNTTICEGNAAHLTASGANSYLWSNGSIFPTTTVHPTTTTTYFVNGIDFNGCPVSNSVTVAVDPVPSLFVTAVSTVVCKGEAVQLTAYGATTYSWAHGGGGNTSNPVTVVDVPTSYSVTGVNNSGCSASASILVDVRACVGLDEISAGFISIYPNPGNGIYSITGGNITKHIIVTDLAGRVVLSKTAVEQTAIIDLTAYSSGMYYVIVNGKSAKVVKQ